MASYEDLRSAIAKTALVREKDGAIIIGNENTGNRESWLFDFRALMLQPKWIDRYAEVFWEHYEDQLPFQVGGMETAGIPLVTAIIMKGVERGTPVNGFFIRKSRKRQGLLKAVEGTLTDEKIILVDDLINSGQTLNRQIDVLRDLDKTVSDIFVMLAFRTDEAYAHFGEHGVRVRHLFTLKDFGIPLLRPRGPEIQQETFDVVWHYKGPAPSFHVVTHKSGPTLDGGRVYVGHDDGTMRALDSETGSVVWEFTVRGFPGGKAILSTPRVHDGVVYFGAYDGNVYALQATTGEKIWEYGDADWIGSSPDISIQDGLLFIGLEFGLFKRSGGIAALDLKTGIPKWTAYHTNMTHASPLYIQQESMVVIGSNEGVLYAYDAPSGQLRWRYATGGDIKMSAAYAPRQRAVLFGSMDGKMYAVSAQDGTPLYAKEADAGIYSTPLVYNNAAYFASLDKKLYAVELGTWKERFVFTTNGRIFSSPVVAENSVWIGSNDGRLCEVDPETGVLKSFFQASERVLSKLAYDAAKKRFYIITVANQVYCLARKTTQ